MVMFVQFFSLGLFITISEGKTPFNDFTQICCKGNVYDILPESEGYVSQCCGTEFFQYYQNENKSTFPMCCEGKFFESSESTSRCCGSDLYDSRNYTCLNSSEIIPIPKENIARNETNICGRGTTFYDPRQKMCCSGALYKFNQQLDCCGNSTYNPATNLCCDGNILEGGFEKECCGGTAYARKEAICCSTLVPSEADSKEGQWVPTVAYYNNKNPIRSGCCNGQIVDFDTEICCKSGPKNKTNVDDVNGNLFCCGDEIMTDFKTQVCVDDKIMIRENENQSYCGTQSFDFNDYICYNNSLIETRKNQTFCYDNGLWRHPTEQICCKDAVIDLKVDDITDHRIYCCDESLSGHLMFKSDK